MSNSQWHNDQAIGEKAMRKPAEETHCVHWWDDDGPCCRCGYNGRRETPCTSCHDPLPIENCETCRARQDKAGR